MLNYDGLGCPLYVIFVQDPVLCEAGIFRESPLR